MQQLTRLYRLSLDVILRVGLFYPVMLACGIGCLFGFSKLANEVLEGELHAVNEAVLSTLHQTHTAILDKIAIGASLLGDPISVVLLMVGFSLFFLRKRRYLDLIMMALLVLGAACLVVSLKGFFHLPRPNQALSIAPAMGYTFPSGHSLMSSALYGYLAAMGLQRKPRHPRNWLLAGLLCSLPIAVMWSRLYLGVHWFSDVIAGALVAGFWVSCCLMLKRYYQRAARRSASDGRRL